VTEYVVRRMLLAIPTILLVIFMTFLIVRLVPGDIVELILAERPYASPEARAEIEDDLGLDKPIPVQFLIYLGDVVQGDLGRSYWTSRPVTEEIGNRMPVTAELGLYSILIGLVVALPVGIVSAVRQDTASDYIARSFAILASSTRRTFSSTIARRTKT